MNPKMTYNMEVSERLVAFGQRLYGTEYGWQTKFANALTMRPQVLHPYLKGDRLPGNTLLARLNKLGCSSDWLLYGDKNDVASISVALTNIPVYAFSEGTKESVVMENIVDYVAVPKTSDETLFGVKVKSESMAPFMKPKDIVIVSEKSKFKTGEACLLQFNDNHCLIRYVHLQEKQFLLTAENSTEFPPQSVPKTKIKRIMRIMKIIRSL